MLIAVIVVVLGLLGWLAWTLLRGRDRETWEPGAQPSGWARVTEVSARKLRREGKGACFLMTVRYSDGFTYVTRAVNSRDGVDDAFKRRVVAKADAAHRSAVRKKKKG